jgi:DNA-binding MarR family transcriptional regulator
MSTPTHPLASETLHKFLTIHRYLRQVARQMDEQGLRPRQFAVLVFLLERGSATVTEIQGHIYTSLSAASTVVSQLESAGYVTRTRSEADNRVVNVELTDAGRALTQNTPLRGIALLRRRLDALPEDRLRALDQTMDELLRLMEVTEAE